MMFLLQVLAFVSILTSVAGKDSPWHPDENKASFVPFPPIVQPRLADELELYQSESYPLPVMRVFQKYPEPPENFERIWPRIKSINRRLHPILWPHVQYYVEDGLEFGCRKPDPDSDTGDTLAITTSHCHRHCLHKGRYCLDEPDIHSDHRRAALKEIIRRLCMDTVYHAKDPRFIAYLQHFEGMECGGDPEADTLPQGGFRNCSLTAMNLAGMKYNDISKCVAEDKYDKDLPHDAMDSNLRQLRNYHHNNTSYNLPYLTINNNKIPDKAMHTTTIFQEYCSYFPRYLERPLACHVCSECDNVRECLWTLKCNGRDFDPNRIRPEVMTSLNDGNQTTQEITDAPPQVPPQNDHDHMVPDEDKEEGEEESDFNTCRHYNLCCDNNICMNNCNARPSHCAPTASNAVPDRAVQICEDFFGYTCDPPADVDEDKEKDEEGNEEEADLNTCEQYSLCCDNNICINNCHTRPHCAVTASDPTANNAVAVQICEDFFGYICDPPDDTSLATTSANKVENNDEDEGEGEGGDLYWIFLMILIVLAFVSGFTYWYTQFKHARARELLKELASGKYSDGTFGLYRDYPDSDAPLGGRVGDEADESNHGDDDRDNGLRSRAMELLSIVDSGISVRNLNTSVKKRESYSKNMDLEGSNHKGFSDDIDELEKLAASAYSDHQPDTKAEQEKDLVIEDVDDLLEDESEWVENKRVNRSSFTAGSILC